MNRTRYKNISVCVVVCLLIAGCVAVNPTKQKNAIELNHLQAVGKEIFFDTQLSQPTGQACGSCHQPEFGFANPEPVNLGANSNLAANRNAPSLSYVSNTPEFKYDTIEGNVVPVGGLFWDGRVDTLFDQALQPFINPLEMGNSSLDSLVEKVKKRPYFKSMIKANKLSKQSSDEIIRAIQNSLVAYQNSPEFNKFNSKYDLWLERKVTLTTLEALGMVVFERIDKGNCAACHTLKKLHVDDRPLLTDFTYDNIGVPANPENPFYDIANNFNPSKERFVDYGLGQSARLKDPRFLGMFKVPSLRNVALSSPYMHNGVFTTLKEVVEFYNSRDLESRWGKPEVPYNVNDAELGNLKLTEIELDALVAFMKTLTDDYVKQDQ